MPPTRDSYWGFPGYLVFALILLVGIGWGLYRIYSRYRLLRLGAAENRFDRPGERLKGVLRTVFAQKGVLKNVSRSDRAGLGHFLIFWGFLTFFVSYAFLLLNSVFPSISPRSLGTGFATFFAYLLDIVGLLVIAAVAWAAGRRYWTRPPRLELKAEAAIILGLIFSLMVAFFFTQALEISLHKDAWGASAPVSGALSRLLANLSPGVQQGLHRFFWWVHLSLIFGFLVYIPYSKHMHILASTFNVFFRNLKPRGALKFLNLEATEDFGAGKINQFTWKQLLDLYTCTECGRCHVACPAQATGKPLSPRDLVLHLKEHLVKEGPALLKKENGKETPTLIGGTVEEEELWACTTCAACMEQCPVCIEHIDKIVDMRRYLVLMEARMPETVGNTLRSLEARGHPWRGTQASRTDWAQGMGIPTLAEKGKAELLYWVGCTAALEERNMKVARAVGGLLKAAGSDFAILGPEEMCCGDPARRMGNEYLFQVLAKQNIETFRRYGVQRIVTACPHCFNTIKNEYPQLGWEGEVTHHSQLLGHLIAQGKLRFASSPFSQITFHDPCYLGRHNHIYSAPRQALRSLPGLKVVEMERSLQNSFCCGGGGGRAFMEESIGQRINKVRTQEALATKAQAVAVACPFCLQMFEDGLRSLGIEDGFKAWDLAEILAHSLPPTA